MEAKQLDICLDAPSLERVKQGRFPFFCRTKEAFEAEGWDVRLRRNGLTQRLAVGGRGGRALFHMEAPSHAGALVCRRIYLGAFWRIEKQAERWEWPVAKAKFDPGAVDRTAAAKFFSDWRKWKFKNGAGVADDGFTFVPLQGRLLEQRSFQAARPVDMIGEVLARFDGEVVATLHPGETYDDEEIEALEQIARSDRRFSFMSQGSDEALRRCGRVVTQNSSLALHGFFLEKPAVLFGGADFHHIAGSVRRDGIEAAFAKVEEPLDFVGYLHWYFQQDVLNASHESFDERLFARLREHGWKI